jgi:hypothetical protein
MPPKSGASCSRSMPQASLPNKLKSSDKPARPNKKGMAFAIPFLPYES